MKIRSNASIAAVAKAARARAKQLGGEWSEWFNAKRTRILSPHEERIMRAIGEHHDDVKLLADHLERLAKKEQP